jgi:DNA-binding Lrp family transcriptional regulator
MPKKIRLDALDIEILNKLQENAKVSNAQLSKEIDLSPAPTLERVKKLESMNIIKGYHARINKEAVGLHVTSFLTVKLIRYSKENLNAFASHVQNIPEVIECHQITGHSHFLLKIVCTSIADYEQLMLERISVIDVLEDLQSMVVMSSNKEEDIIPVPFL